ncbi:hypothetical protein EYF80_056534 [Liparis tanakae]|uniref:Uncharacterized protein n=1 Tax=Liparis tanakae TaxID=230148 RepID=A0A4Z2EYL1_9TELE|nr:hypothetical protein EYF80_056534 [Liparis tanakae]
MREDPNKGHKSFENERERERNARVIQKETTVGTAVQIFSPCFLNPHGLISAIVKPAREKHCTRSALQLHALLPAVAPCMFVFVGTEAERDFDMFGCPSPRISVKFLLS